MRRVLLFVLISLSLFSSAFAENRPLRRELSPPVPPIPAAMAVPQPMRIVSTVRAAVVPPSVPAPPGGNLETVLIPLSPGLSMISIPVQTTSNVLSDLLPNLPDGSRVWTWDAVNQQFVEGFDAELPFGQGCLLYVPLPTILSVTGQFTDATATPVELQLGWNLVGVPSTSAIPLAVQTVYVDQVETSINDAIDSGALGPAITTIDSGGYINILGSEDQSLQPARSYWVYSDGNAELLQLRQPALQAFDPTFGQWFASQLGQAGLKWVLGTAYDNLNPNSTQNQLLQISSDLASVKNTLQKVSDKVDGLANRIAESENKILLSIQESRIGTPQTTLQNHYFDEKSSDSFMFFVKNPASATVDNKIAYSLNVIRNWGVKDDFNNIHTAIKGSLATPGIMDLFANLIVINNTDRPNSTVNDRYDAMQAYFNKLIGYQIELSTMVKGAYDTLVKADPSKLPAGFEVAPNAADQWTKQFQSNIQEEYQIYRAIVERIAVSRILNDPTGALYPARLDEQTQIMLGKLDNMMMWAFAEMTGLRVRVIVSPDMNPTNTYFVDFPDRPRVLLPSTDSGLWTPVTATGLPAGVSPFYDSWRLRLADSLPEFTATNTWLLYRNAPLSIVGTTKVDVNDKRGLVRDKVPRGTAGGISVRTAYFDQNYREADVSAGGVLFGSVTVVRRASAKSMLSFCGIAATVTDNCATFVGASLLNCSTMNFSNTTCPQPRDFPRPAMHVRREQKFGYFGTAELNGTVTVSQTISPCTGVFSSVGKNQTSIFDNLNSALIFLSAGYVNTSLTANVTWKPGLSYFFIVDTIPAGCSGTTSYTAGPVVMTFPP